MAERPVRPRWVLAAVVLAGVAALILVPHPLVRGIILGVLLTVSGLAAAGFALSRRLKSGLQSAMEPPPLPNTQWDSQLRVQSLDGDVVDFATLSGRALVLNFWATTCAPCVAEMPSLARLHEETADDGIFVGCITREPEERVRDFVSRRGLEGPVYLMDAEVPGCFATRGIPATFILDRDHRIVFRHVGAADWSATSVVDFLRSLTAPGPL